MSNKVNIKDLEVDYEVIHRKIKYPRLEIKTGKLILILPEGYDDYDSLLEKHQNWIYNKSSIIQDSENYQIDENRTEIELKELVKGWVDYYVHKMNIKPQEIKFRKMKARWGSCDSQGNLKFNTMMKYLPENLIKYVVFHEMVHLLEFGHNRDFWQIIQHEYGNYKEMDRELSVYWFAIKRHKGF